MDSGELLARVHSVVPDLGIPHGLRPPDERFVGRVTHVVDPLGPAAAGIVEVGADLLREEMMTRRRRGSRSPWETGPAYDIARWEVSAGDPLHDRSDGLRSGNARVTDPDSADAGWGASVRIDWALEVLSWQNPAPAAKQRRCVDVVARYAGA